MGLEVPIPIIGNNILYYVEILAYVCVLETHHCTSNALYVNVERMYFSLTENTYFELSLC